MTEGRTIRVPVSASEPRRQILPLSCPDLTVQDETSVLGVTRVLVTPPRNPTSLEIRPDSSGVRRGLKNGSVKTGETLGVPVVVWDGDLQTSRGRFYDRFRERIYGESCQPKRLFVISGHRFLHQTSGTSRCLDSNLRSKPVRTTE